MKKTVLIIMLLAGLGEALSAQTYDTVTNRYRRYYYRQWYDTCRYFFDNRWEGNPRNIVELKLSQAGTQFGWNSFVAVSEYTDSPLTIEGIAVMVNFPVSWEHSQKPYHAEEYVYLAYYDSVANQMNIVDSARWDTARTKIMKLPLIADPSMYRDTLSFPGGVAYCYLYEAYFRQPVTMDSVFYVIGSMHNEEVDGLHDIYEYIPVHYGQVLHRVSGPTECIPNNPRQYVRNYCEGHLFPYQQWSVVFFGDRGGYGPFLPILNTQHLVTVLSADTSMGDVRGGSYCRDSSVTQLRALPRYGYKFSHWNDGDTTNPRQVLVTCDTVFTAYFSEATYYQLSVMTNNENWGTVSGAGSYPEGTEVRIEARAAEGASFVCWDDSVWTNPRQVRVTCDTAFTALFRPVPVGIAAPAETSVGFELVPNPTRDRVELRIADFENPRYNYRDAAVVVLDVAGHEVLRQKVTAPVMHLDLKGLPAGAYFVTLVTPQGSHTEKLFVK